MDQGLLSKKRGISLIEVLIGVSILALVTITMLFTMTLFLETRGEVMKKTKALYLAEEGLEVLRYLRDEDWEVFGTELSTDTVYYFSLSDTEVATTTSPEIIDGTYLREFEIHDVYRNNTSDDIVASTTGSSYVDSETMEVVVRVGFSDSTTTVRTLLTNIFDI